MPEACPTPDAKRPDPDGGEVSRDVRLLDQLSWRNWVLIVTMTMINALALIVGVLPYVRQQVSRFWPWGGTDAALVAGLAVLILVVAAHLTHRERQASLLRRRLAEAHARSQERMQRHCDRLYALLTVSRAAGTETNPQAIFDVITRTCQDTFTCDQVSLMLLDRASGELEVRSATGHQNVEQVLGRRARIGEGIAGWVAQHREPVLVGRTVDASRYPGFFPKEHAPSSAMVVPIEVRGELVGVLNLSNRSGDVQYETDDLQALQVFAETAGLVCRHAEQASWMRQTIHRLDEALRERDAQARAA